MSKKSNFITSIVGIIFGLTILLVSIFTEAGVACIVLGAVLLGISIACLVFTIIEAKAEERRTKILLEKLKLYQECLKANEEEIKNLKVEVSNAKNCSQETKNSTSKQNAETKPTAKKSTTTKPKVSSQKTK